MLPDDDTLDPGLTDAEHDLLTQALMASLPRLEDGAWARLLEVATDPSTADPGVHLVTGSVDGSGPFEASDELGEPESVWSEGALDADEDEVGGFGDAEPDTEGAVDWSPSDDPWSTDEPLHWDDSALVDRTGTPGVDRQPDSGDPGGVDL